MGHIHHRFHDLHALAAVLLDVYKRQEWNIRTEHEGMFTEMGIKIKALIARKDPDPASVTLSLIHI